MKTWITSDLHLGHARIMEFCPESRSRFNGDVGFMNEAMVREWNELIAPGDLVYLLGDVAFLSAAKTNAYLRRMHGDKILIEGNHDNKLVLDKEFRAEFKSIHQYLEITHAGHKIVMSHYPFLEWNQMGRGALHFYGHKHGGACPEIAKYRARDMGMDATGVIAMTLEDAIKDALTGEIKSHNS